MAPLAMPSIARIAAISPFIASSAQGSYFHWPLTSRTITSARSSTP